MDARGGSCCAVHTFAASGAARRSCVRVPPRRTLATLRVALLVLVPASVAISTHRGSSRRHDFADRALRAAVHSASLGVHVPSSGTRRARRCRGCAVLALCARFTLSHARCRVLACSAIVTSFATDGVLASAAATATSRTRLRVLAIRAHGTDRVALAVGVVMRAAGGAGGGALLVAGLALLALGTV